MKVVFPFAEEFILFQLELGPVNLLCEVSVPSVSGDDAASNPYGLVMDSAGRVVGGIEHDQNVTGKFVSGVENSNSELKCVLRSVNLHRCTKNWEGKDLSSIT